MTVVIVIIQQVGCPFPEVQFLIVTAIYLLELPIDHIYINCWFPVYKWSVM